MYKNKNIAVVVPAYNEEKLISEVIRGMPHYVDYICVVDDASKDATAEIAARLASLGNRFIDVIRHQENGGVGKAIVTGYKNSLAHRAEIIAIMAGDNQMDPTQLPGLLDPIVEGEADYAVGDRISHLKHMKGMSYWRRSGNWILRWLTRIAAGNMAICDPQNGYTAISKEALSRLDLDHIFPRYGYCNDILVKLAVARSRIVHVAMPAVYGSEKSKIKYYRYIPSVSWLLLKDFLWRIEVQVFLRGKASSTQNNFKLDKSAARHSPLFK